MTTPPNPPEDQGGWTGGGQGDQPPGGAPPPPGGGYGPPPGGGYPPPPPPGGGYGAPPPGYGQPAQSNTPMVLGIIGIVTWFCCPVAAIVLGLIGQSKAKETGQALTLPKVAWIGGIVALVLYIVYWIFAIAMAANDSTAIGY